MTHNIPETAVPEGTRLLDIRQVAAKFGGERPLNPATVWRRLRKEADFPRPARVGYNTVRWSEAEIDTFIASKLARRDDPTAQTEDRTRIERRRLGRKSAS